MSCPSCGSDEWKSASLVHKEGLSTSDSKSVGAGITSRGAFGVGGASTSGAQQTELSKAAAPPTVFVMTGVLLMATLLTGIVGFFFNWVWLLTALCAYGVVTVYRAESKQDDILSERYKKTQMCTRCGTFYVQEKPS
jgi:hypothetical protein